MRVLKSKYCSKISGAGRWSSDSPSWGSLPYSPIPEPTKSEFDYGLMSIIVANAALFGCINGSLKGGLYGCIASGGISGAGAMYAFIAADAYKSYTSNKR